MSKKTTSHGYNVIKKDSSDEDSYSDSDTNSGGAESAHRYVSIADSTYKKPRGGSVQENFTKDQIREKLHGYRALKTPHDQRFLLTLKPFKVWIRYFNTVTKEFRVGGLLKLVDPELRYIMLVNTSKNLTWSVQLKDCIIFVPKDIEQKTHEKEKIQFTKDKLFKLYQQGKLRKQ